ncbi:uncharacterized protein LOC123680349 [Harmonia axyridis]|uniref:uncharacterized protein LOC123680349 n=1 Tax=Harmonia axyridis TaxID=115357 RepID=UPI001E276657|nr:uncharacterized protein LOC123680349 [Harmonia axyridis]
MFVKCVVFALVASVVYGRSTTSHQNSIQDDHKARASDSTSYYGDIRYLYKVYQECSATDFSSCLKLKLVAALDRVARSADFTLFDAVTFVKDPAAPAEQPKSEAEIEANLPRSLDEKDSALNNMLTSKVSSFFDTHSVQLKFPSMSDLQRSLSDEGRKKSGKGGKGGLMILPLILGGTLVPLALGALALLAGKALIVSKLALVLAAIIGLKKLLGGGGRDGHESGHEVVVSGGHGGHSGWGRSYEKEEAQNLAYNAYVQKTR